MDHLEYLNRSSDRRIVNFAVVMTFLSITRCWIWLTFGICSMSVSAETRIGVGSCFDQAKSPAIWEQIASEDFDGFLFLGDNVYASRHFSEVNLKAAYERASSVIPWDQLGFIHATWDDHDFGRNDGGSDFVGQSISRRLFWQFFGPHMDVQQVSPHGIYHSAIREIEGLRTQFIALDTRSFRGQLKPTLLRNTPGAERYVPNFDLSQSMLGEEQWTWLEDALKRPADIRILMSSIQILAEGHGWERWGNLPHERDRLLGMLRLRSPSDLLLVSGDRHVGGAYQLVFGGERFIEITSSGLNMAWSRATEYLPNQIGDPIREDHYAVFSMTQAGLRKVIWYGREGRTLAALDLSRQLRVGQ
jgi:alkaline phosphatase D